MSSSGSRQFLVCHACVFVFLCTVLLAAQPRIAQSRQVVISHVNVVPMDAEHVLNDRTVVVENGKIAKISEGEVPAAKDALVIDGRGKYLMPGLADSACASIFFR